MIKKLSIILALIFLMACSSTRNAVNLPAEQAGSKFSRSAIKLTTDSGVIVLRLYNKTPLHRDNFIKLVKQHYFDDVLFHRVIKNFMIQGGDPNSKNAKPLIQLGNGGPGYTIPAEFDTSLFHKKGVLAAAREGDNANPKKASSGSQFYIVQGKKFTDAGLDSVETFRLKGRKLPIAHRDVYKTIGGTPHLDMNYTVFGEVESGLEVVDKIAAAVRDTNNRPLNDIKMKMRILRKR
ncbi:MAG TPA: peptidylprolyl isomerase [Chitinophagaceae bacterium]|nr:peptidylprolyl isomerase [Chitinophagaceae bacterium]